MNLNPQAFNFLPAGNGTNGNTSTTNTTPTNPLNLQNLPNGLNLGAMNSLPLPMQQLPTDNKGTPTIPLMPVILTPNDAIRALATSLPVNAQTAQNPAMTLPTTTATQNANALNALNAINALQTASNASGSSSSLMSLLSATSNTNASTATTNSTGVNNAQSAAEKEAAELRQELERERNKMQLIQTAYWSLRGDFDNVCDVLKSMENNKTAASVMMANQSNSKGSGKKTKLNTITEGES